MRLNVETSPYAVIQTRFLAPTNQRGERIVVSAGKDRPRKIVAWDYALDVAQNHAAAAKLYAAEMEWNGDWLGGDSGDGYTFVSRRER